MQKPEVSLGVSLATMTVAFALYNRGLPTSADIRAGKPGEANLEAVRKQNAWMAAGAVAAISLLAKDLTVFTLGAATVVALDWVTRVNNWTNPITGSVHDNPFIADDMSGQAPTTVEPVDYNAGLQAVM